MQKSKILLLRDTISKRVLYSSVYYQTPPAYIRISSVKGPRKPPCAVPETKKLKNGHVLDKCTLVIKRDTSFIRLCRKVSHLSRFDSDSLYSESVVCKRLQVVYQLPLEIILFYCSLVHKIFHLLTGFSVVNPDVVKPDYPIGMNRIFPGEINVRI